MTEIEAEREMTRDEVADYLREFADQLDRTGPEIPTDDVGTDDGKVTLVVGNDSATINPPETVVFEIEVESDTSLVGTDVEESVEFGLTWRAEDIEEHDEIEIM